MLKWIAFILFNIVLVATFIPCCGDDDCCTTEAADKKHDSRDEGACSPLFACHSCSCVAEVSKPEILFTPAEEALIHYPKNIPFTLSSYSDSPEQPPCC